MKRLIHTRGNISARTSIQENNDFFTIQDISNLLLEISELNGHNISIKKGRAGTFKISVGNSVYDLTTKKQTVYGEN